MATNVPDTSPRQPNVPSTTSPGAANVPDTAPRSTAVKSQGRATERLTPDAVVRLNRNARPFTGQRLAVVTPDGKKHEITGSQSFDLAIVGKDSPVPRVLDFAPSSGLPIVELS